MRNHHTITQWIIRAQNVVLLTMLGFCVVLAEDSEKKYQAKVVGNDFSKPTETDSHTNPVFKAGKKVPKRFTEQAQSSLDSLAGSNARNRCVASKQNTRFILQPDLSKEEAHTSSPHGFFSSIKNKVVLSCKGFVPAILRKNINTIMQTLSHELHHLANFAFNKNTEPFSNEEEFNDLQVALNQGAQRIINAYDILMAQKNGETLSAEESQFLNNSLQAAKEYNPSAPLFNLGDANNALDMTQMDKWKVAKYNQKKQVQMNATLFGGHQRVITYYLDGHILQPNGNQYYFGSSLFDMTTESKLISLYTDLLLTISSLEKGYGTNDGPTLLMELDAKIQERGDDINQFFFPERVDYHSKRLAPMYRNFGC